MKIIIFFMLFIHNFAITDTRKKESGCCWLLSNFLSHPKNILLLFEGFLKSSYLRGRSFNQNINIVVIKLLKGFRETRIHNPYLVILQTDPNSEDLIFVLSLSTSCRPITSNLLPLCFLILNRNRNPKSGETYCVNLRLFPAPKLVKSTEFGFREALNHKNGEALVVRVCLNIFLNFPLYFQSQKEV